MLRTICVFSTALISGSAFGSVSYSASPAAVPVDSPLALAGLAAAIGLLTVRVLKDRNK